MKVKELREQKLKEGRMKDIFGFIEEIFDTNNRDNLVDALMKEFDISKEAADNFVSQYESLRLPESKQSKKNKLMEAHVKDFEDLDVKPVSVEMVDQEIEEVEHDDDGEGTLSSQSDYAKGDLWFEVELCYVPTGETWKESWEVPGCEGIVTGYDSDDDGPLYEVKWRDYDVAELDDYVVAPSKEAHEYVFEHSEPITWGIYHMIDCCMANDGYRVDFDKIKESTEDESSGIFGSKEDFERGRNVSHGSYGHPTYDELDDYDKQASDSCGIYAESKLKESDLKIVPVNIKYLDDDLELSDYDVLKGSVYFSVGLKNLSNGEIWQEKYEAVDAKGYPDISGSQSYSNGMIEVDYSDVEWDEFEYAESCGPITKPSDESYDYFMEHEEEIDEVVSDLIWKCMNNDLRPINLKESKLKENDNYKGWNPHDIELHKSINWKDRHYDDYVDKDDYFDDNVKYYSSKGLDKVTPTRFYKHIHANNVFPPVYKPDMDSDKDYTSPMYDGNHHGDNGYQVHDRRESWDLYDMMSR